MAVLSGRDADRWERLGGRVAEVVEPVLGPRVLAGRSLRAGGMWWTDPVGAALGRARRAARRLTEAASVIVRTDVRDFYPSIDPSTLSRCLREVGVTAEDAGTAASMVEGWGSEGYPGLPVGPPASAVLANAVLAPVDEGMGDTPWLRWCDDLLIGVRSPADADRLLDRVDAELARLGLHRSVPKTHVLEPTAIRWPGSAGSALR
jgi:Reverse transcriptase (RNA-dependent DNA polymerase)